MTDDEREKIRITMNVIGDACNECSRAIRYVEAAWEKEEYGLFTSPKATDAVFAFIEMLPLIKEKASAADEALWECYRK